MARLIGTELIEKMEVSPYNFRNGSIRTLGNSLTTCPRFSQRLKTLLSKKSDHYMEATSLLSKEMRVF